MIKKYLVFLNVLVANLFKQGFRDLLAISIFQKMQ